MSTRKLSSYDAECCCDDCDFKQNGKNAHGLAAIHHNKTGHTVHIDVYRGYTITSEDSEWYKGWRMMKNDR